MERHPRRRGQVAVLSVTHPILGIELAVGAHTIRIGPEQYLELVDCLCNIAWLTSHHADRIRALGLELKVPEIVQYIDWMREADRLAAARVVNSTKHSGQGGPPE